jgi:pimeloyl-ACP methyl ester carboxylesterase
MNTTRTLSTPILALLLSAAAAGALPQVTGLQARHRSGQTFLTWQEVNSPLTQERVSFPEFRRIARGLDTEGTVRYRIYRSLTPITRVEGLAPVAEARPLSCWNGVFNGAGEPKETDLVPRFVIEDGQSPLPPGTGLYVHSPRLPANGAEGEPSSARAFYALTHIINGVENKSVGPTNSLEIPLAETSGQGEPVLQRIERPGEFNYVKSPTLHYFVRWEAPPNCNRENQPIDYVVGIPPQPLNPAPVTILLHCWGGNLNSGYGWWFNAEKGSMMIAANQIPYDWWTGYHERYGQDPPSRETSQQGVVRPYTQTRLLSFLDWAGTRWPIDQTRIAVGGSSMGGSGAPMFAIRHPDRIAWAIGWVGVHIPELSPTFSNSYAQVYGSKDWNVRFEDGTPVWDYFNDAWYLRNHPGKDIGFISWSNGKNDGGIGWKQAVEFYRAMQETRRPHLFVWGQSGHGQRAVMPGGTREERNNPLDIRVDQSLPAFTSCSLDGNPGNGQPEDGDPTGAVNAFLLWETSDIVDETNRWAMTVFLAGNAPDDTCTTTLTPRRLQSLKPKPGDRFRWANTSSGPRSVVQSGDVTADRWGLVTIEKLVVSKTRNRVVIERR